MRQFGAEVEMDVCTHVFDWASPVSHCTGFCDHLVYVGSLLWAFSQRPT
jgi:hypothetical protein